MRTKLGVGVMGFLAVVIAAACSSPPEETQEVTEDELIFSSTEILSPPIQHFKYGSIGTDKLGVPLAVLKAIPLVCADLLPAGTDPRNQPLAAFGLIYERGHELPVGFSTRKVPFTGVTLVGNNCSVCHTSTVRETATSARTIHFGAPATRFDIEAYQSFMFNCISDKSRFNTTGLNRAFDDLGIFGTERIFAFNSTLMRAFLADTQTKVKSVVRDGPWGPGRDDALGLAAAILLGPEFLPKNPSPVDFPAVWNQAARRGGGLHWDGSSLTAFDRNVAVAVAAGAPRSGVPLESLAAVQTFLDTLPSPKYPFPIDTTLAARGAKVFRARCFDCHGQGGARTLQVTNIDEIGTDRIRNDNVTQASIDRTNSVSGPGWKITQFRKTNGYANGLLDGIWLRAPYLHNGSVPTLRDLLKAPAARPRTFFSGNDVYDPRNVGFVSNVGTEGAKKYNAFDTTRRGNGNGGHFGAAYGTDLDAADTDALLEYLKTL